MKGHQPNIKSLSTAIKHGAKMAEERGIGQAYGSLAKEEAGEVCSVCALGAAILGKFGIETARKVATGDVNGYGLLQAEFPIVKEKNTCLTNRAGLNINYPVEDVVFQLNDRKGKSFKEIAEVLESCKL
jgi:hypothetical protein